MLADTTQTQHLQQRETRPSKVNHMEITNQFAATSQLLLVKIIDNLSGGAMAVIV